MNEYVAGSTSVVDLIVLMDNTSTTGGRKTGLAFNTASLTCYYKRSNGSASVAVTLATITTLGTYTSGGFKEIDATNMPGAYEFHPPNAAFASGAKEVTFTFTGAAGMVTREVKYRILAVDPDDAVHGGMSAIPNTACTTNASLLTSGTGTDQLSVTTGRVDVGKALGTAVTLDSNNVLNVSTKYLAGTGLTGRDIGASVLLSSGTGTGQLDFTSGIVKTNVTQLLGTAWLTPSVAGTPDVNAKQLGGTAQTGRDVGASVLLSSGTGTGQLDFTSGVVKSNLVQILGTALTETAGLIAGAFKKFFNVATPTGTVNSLADAVPGAAGGGFIAGSNAAVTVASFTNSGTWTQTGNATFAGTFGVGGATTFHAITTADLTLGSISGVALTMTGGVDLQGNVFIASGAGNYTTISQSQITGTDVANLTTLAAAVNAIGPVYSSTASAATAGSITLAGGSSVNDHYTGQWVTITTGTGAGQTRLVTAYDGSTKVATVARNWTTTPNNASTFAVLHAANIGGDWSLLSNATATQNLSGTTVNLVNTATVLTNAPSDSSGTTTLLTRLSATRAGYLDNLSAGAVAQAATALSTAQWTNARSGYLDNLSAGAVALASTALSNVQWTNARAGYIDNLNIGGNVSSAASVSNISNNTFIGTNVPQILERPDSGSTTVQIVVIFNDDTGAAVNIDSSATPTVTLVNNAGTDVSSRLGSWSNPATGKFVANYTNTSSDSIDDLHWDISGTVNSKLRRWVGMTQIVDTTAVSFTSSDRTLLTTLAGDYTTARAAKIDNLDATVSSRAATSALPSNFSNLLITAAGKISEVVLLTGNTVQTGDAFARIGAAGAGLTALGDTRIANLDAAMSTRATPAQVKTQADQALVDVGVTSARQGYLDRFNGMIVLSGSAYRFTAAALALAPSGGGGGGTKNVSVTVKNVSAGAH